MLKSNRRTAMKILALAPVVAGATMGVAFPASAQAVDPVVARKYENIKRGTIHTLDPATRGFVIVWQDLGRVKLKAADVVTNYGQLKQGQIVDVHWYDYIDFLVAKTTPAISAQAKAMVASGARAEGLPTVKQAIRLQEMSGMVVSLDQAHYTIEAVNPASGEVLRYPQIITEAGLAAFKTLKPGDAVTTVFSIQTAISVTIIR